MASTLTPKKKEPFPCHENKEIEVNRCKNCKHLFKSLLKHLGQTKLCHQSYSEREMYNLKEKIKEKNCQKVRQRKKDHYDKNKEAKKKKMSDYYQENSDKIREKMDEYYHKNKYKILDRKYGIKNDYSQVNGVYYRISKKYPRKRRPADMEKAKQDEEGEFKG